MSLKDILTTTPLGAPDDDLLTPEQVQAIVVDVLCAGGCGCMIRQVPLQQARCTAVYCVECVRKDYP